MATRKPRKPRVKTPKPDSREAGISKRETLDRIEIIEKMMAAGIWTRGISDRALAEKWGVTPHRVRQLASEASRGLRRLEDEDPEYRESLRAEILQTFAVVRHRALEFADSPAALRVAMEAASTLARYHGIEPAPALNLQIGGQFGDWSSAELTHYAETGERPER